MNRFWKRNSQPLHDVTHRAIGDIPGCKMLTNDHDRYVGYFPSQSACDFINEMKDKMKFFDDGERIVYGPNPFRTRKVAVTPITVNHPIAHPPAGFVLNTDSKGAHEWVRSE